MYPKGDYSHGHPEPLDSTSVLAELDAIDREREARIRVSTPLDERERIVEEMVLEAGARMMLTARLLERIERETAESGRK